MDSKTTNTSSFSIETFSIPLELKSGTDALDASKLQERLESELLQCRKILRWAIVRTEPVVQKDGLGDNTILCCEGAYEKLI